MLFEHKGNVIQKSTKPCRKQGDYNPDFIKNIYNHKKHDNYLNTNITIGNTVPQDIKKKLLDVIKEYWCCFDPDGVKIPISDYDKATEPFQSKQKYVFLCFTYGSKDLNKWGEIKKTAAKQGISYRDLRW